MPQWRKLQTRITESDDLNAMPDDFARLVWVLLPLGLDREGRALDNPSLVKARIMPLRDDVTPQRMGEALDCFAARGLIRRYQVGGRRFFWVPTFGDDQGNTSKEAESLYPAPEQVRTNSRPTQDLVRTNSGPTPDQVESKSGASRELVRTNSGTDADADSDADSDAEAEEDSDSEGETDSDRESDASAYTDAAAANAADAAQTQRQSLDFDPKSFSPTPRKKGSTSEGHNEVIEIEDDDAWVVRDAVIKASHEFHDSAGVESNLTQLRNVWQASGLDAADMLEAVTEASKRTRVYASAKRGVRNRMGYWFRVLRDVADVPAISGPG